MAGALVAVYSAVSTTTVVQAASQNSNRMPIERCIIDGFREREERDRASGFNLDAHSNYQ